MEVGGQAGGRLKQVSLDIAYFYCSHMLKDLSRIRRCHITLLI